MFIDKFWFVVYVVPVNSQSHSCSNPSWKATGFSMEEDEMKFEPIEAL